MRSDAFGLAGVSQGGGTPTQSVLQFLQSTVNLTQNILHSQQSIHYISLIGQAQFQ